MPKILAIDDNQDILVSISALLRKLIRECTVVTSDSGAEGIKKAEAEQPDTILLDVKMPEMDGFEVCRRLKSNEKAKHIPVVMLTGIKTDTESRIKGLELGADAFLSKPIDEVELAAHVKAMLRIKTAEDLLRKKKDLLEDTLHERTKALRESKQTEDELRKSEEQFRSLVGNIPGVSYRCRCDEQWTMDFISDEVRNLTGYPASDFLQNAVRSWASIMHPEGKEASDERVMEKINRKEPYTTEYRIIGADGDIRWCYEKGQGVFDEQGKLCFLDGVIIDHTDRKQAEEALRESEGKYRTILESIEDGYYEIDLGGNFIFFNDSMCKISGYSRDELMGMNNRQYTDEVYAKEIYQTFNKVYTTGKPNKSFHWSVIRKDGTKRTVAASVSLRRDTEGEPIGFQGIVRDITAQKFMQVELLKAKKLESVGVLAGGIAHDFNNLMSAVVGYISLAKMEMKPGSKGFKNLIGAEKASIQTKDLTSRLITFSEGGEPVKETVPIGDLVKDSVGSSLKGSNIICRFSISDDISLVKADEEQMKQAVHNIITNAQEAMAGQGTINVSCENTDIGVQNTLTLKVGKYVKISIEDQGPGIPEEDLIKIFDPYFSTKEMGTQKGMGLGLAVSDSIVKQHDGLITVKSELGTGTILSIYLPASEKEIVEAVPVKKPVPEISVTQGGKILVMDDEEVIRDVCNALLTHLGYEAEVAVEGVEAIEMYTKAMESEKPFDMVILDLTNKVGMGGAETILRLLEIDPDVKAIVATGYSGDPIMSKFREHGFCGALPKPFTLDQLKTALHDAIAGE